MDFIMRKWLRPLYLFVFMAASTPLVGYCGDGYIGAAEANSRFFISETGSGDGYNYLALRDHHGPSGVPLGGIGAGCVQFAPDGHFTRTSGINNWFTDSATEFRWRNTVLESGHFLAVWDQFPHATVVRRLQRDNNTVCGLKAFPHSTYCGLFPSAQIHFSDEPYPPSSAASVRIYSGLVPHALRDSTLPAFWVEVTLANNNNSLSNAVAFSWADLLGRGLLDAKDVKTISDNPFVCSQADFQEVPRPVTVARPVTEAGWQGVLQTIPAGLPAPRKLTYQTGVTQVLILAEPQPDAVVTWLPAYAIAQGENAWKSFAQTGRFPEAVEGGLSGPGQPDMASAVAITAKVPVGGKRTFRFLVAWYAPPVEPDPARANDPRYRFGSGDYGTWYQNHYRGAADVAAYAIANGQRIWDGIRAWQDPILASNLPDWLQFKLINSAYTLFSNTILNRAGDFTVHEGGMGGLSGTMDVRMIVHPLYQKFFPELDRRELLMFANSQEPEVYPAYTWRGGLTNNVKRVGAISHMIGNYFTGIASATQAGPCIEDVNMDGTCAYIMQIVKDYEQTGDRAWLMERADNIRKAVRYLQNNIVDGRGIPNGRATYDDYHHPEVFAYNASIFLVGMEAAIRAARVLQDKELLARCQEMQAKARRGYMSLWNGRFFAYGARKDSSELINNRFHQGQVGGQSLNRFCGWGDIVSPAMLDAVLTAQCKLVLSKVPDYYANKVWDLDMDRGVDNTGSQCWPFQLEAFTAMPMIQNGWIADGFDIMRHLQLVHLRHGLTWAQNLWNPGELTRMDAPVTWMVLDNLAGAAVNVPEGRLTLGPGVIPGEGRLIVPLYFPKFWAVLDYQPLGKRSVLKITRTLGDVPVTFTRLTGQPMGRPAAEGKTVRIKPFIAKAGAELDLSPYLDLIGPPRLHRSVLTRSAQEPFVAVEPKNLK
jgi:non-lysosomal glucosylceramidase